MLTAYFVRCISWIGHIRLLSSIYTIPMYANFNLCHISWRQVFQIVYAATIFAYYKSMKISTYCAQFRVIFENAFLFPFTTSFLGSCDIKTWDLKRDAESPALILHINLRACFSFSIFPAFLSHLRVFPLSFFFPYIIKDKIAGWEKDRVPLLCYPLALLSKLQDAHVDQRWWFSGEGKVIWEWKMCYRHV